MVNWGELRLYKENHNKNKTMAMFQALSSAEATLEQQQNLCQLKVVPFASDEDKTWKRGHNKESFILLTFDILPGENVEQKPNYVSFVRKLGTSYISQYCFS